MTRPLRPSVRPILALGGAGVLLLASLMTSTSTSSTASTAADTGGDAPSGETREPALIPRPSSMRTLGGPPFEIDGRTAIGVSGGPSATRVAESLATLLRRSTGFAVPVRRHGDIQLTVPRPGAIGKDLGPEGYTLDVDAHGTTIRAATAAGLFRGTTTLRQLLPPEIEYETVQPGPWTVAATSIRDRPRFAYRGAMLDVSRHFFSVSEVKRYIDLASMYKLNRLHLHLSDDQGWRIAIDSWPRLARYGGSTEVGGGRGGSYTKEQYAEIVRYAADRYLTVVPEIDTPSHTNAALASYAKLNCDGKAPPLYTGTDVGFSSLCIPKAVTYRFLEDVFGELAEMTPGPTMHFGGDEAHSTPHDQYLTFVEKAAATVGDTGKGVMGWQEIAASELPAESTIQYWGTGDEDSAELARAAVAQGASVVMSPANRSYLDMKYNEDTPYGLEWAGLVPVRKSYSWDPATQVEGVPEASIDGVEAALWSETLDEISKAEFMAYPRLPGIAEIGWSPAAGRAWPEYKQRLGAQGARWDVLAVNYYHAPGIDWSSAG